MRKQRDPSILIMLGSLHNILTLTEVEPQVIVCNFESYTIESSRNAKSETSLQVIVTSSHDAKTTVHSGESLCLGISWWMSRPSSIFVIVCHLQGGRGLNCSTPVTTDYPYGNIISIQHLKYYVKLVWYKKIN